MSMSMKEKASRTQGLAPEVVDLLERLEQQAESPDTPLSLDAMRAAVHEVEGAGVALPAVEIKEC